MYSQSAILNTVRDDWNLINQPKGKHYMAKVTITAKALIRDGDLLCETTRADVLATLGKNRPLIAEMKQHNQPLVRTKTIDGDEFLVIATPDTVNRRVTVQVVAGTDVNGTVAGTATFGYTSFFKCLDEGDED